MFEALRHERRRTLIQFQKFAIAGAIAAAVQYAILILLVSLFGVRPVVASTFGYLLSALLNYYLNHRLTFQSDRGHMSAIPRFFAVVGVGLLINGAVVWLLGERWSAPYLLAQLVATGVVLNWNFFANRKWTY